MAHASDPPAPHAGRRPNHLIHEKSPYLLQHAYNPVDWYPWGPEAFAKAKREDKPIFLSIGYATCHWCHVMEQECFEDPEVARLMNETFVSIKVDREERPDIDQVYMAVCQMLTGSGGWPLTIVMTPDKRPFFAGTFFPKHSRFGRPGLLELVPKIGELWRTRRAELLASADKIVAQLATATAAGGGGKLKPEVLDAAFTSLRSRFDPEYGGFGSRPKFPTPHNLTFLLRMWRRTGSPKALEMVEKTLTGMRRGGIFDHVGFGFHRYSTDRRWLVPHFEKMLYDQALLTIAYLEAYQATGKAEYAATARQTLAYVLRDLRAPGGAFYSAEDADSEGQEGKFYLWTAKEVRSLLAPAEARVAIAAWNIEPDGNFPDELGGLSNGSNILHRTADDAGLAHSLGLTEKKVHTLLEAARKKLFAARSHRVRPFLDDKILTDWNGLMIAALARAGRVLDEPTFTAAAAKAAGFVLKTMRTADGALMHRYRDGDVSVPGFLDDHAFLTWGLLELYESTYDPDVLQIAVELAEAMTARFAAPGGGLYMTAEGAERLLVRPRDTYDGAVPSGASVALEDLLELSRLTGREAYARRADALLTAVAGEVAQNPAAHTFLLGAYSTLHAPTFEVVVLGDPGEPATQGLVRPLRTAFLPGTVTLVVPPGAAGRTVRSLAPFTASHRRLGGRPTAFVCRGFSCKLPTTDPAAVMRQLEVRE